MNELANGVRFTRPRGSWQYRVTLWDEPCGRVWQNGSNLRERSWTAQDGQGRETRHGSRRSAANWLVTVHTGREALASYDRREG